MASIDKQAWDTLKNILQGIPVWGIALSGGIDSRFLCHAALRMGCKVMAFHISGPHMPEAETAQLCLWAGKAAVPLTLISFSPLTLPAVHANTIERCYQCKKAIFFRIAQQWTSILADGSTLSDAAVFRPGKRALLELGVRSPLVEAGITKQQLRRLAVASGLDNPSQVSRPCLLTRLAYGITPHEELLRSIAVLERRVATLLHAHSGTEKIAAFRLRLVTEKTLELHIQAEDADGNPTLLHELNAMLRQEVAKLPLSLQWGTVRYMENLSGYFDSLS